MKLRDNKGSITIFVLVGLLFMTSFLIISFGSNVNKSKSAKEQFNILSSIYSFNDGDESAYMRAYTALRKQNAQQLNASVENSNTLNLTKTFVDTISDYKIYGNSVQDTSKYGTPSPSNPVEVQSVGDRTINLFDINNLKSSNNVVNNNNGTISVTASVGSSGVASGQTNKLSDYAPELEVGKTYVLSANTTGKIKYIYLNITKSVWMFGSTRTITEDDLNSVVYWYANGDTDTSFTAILSEIQIEQSTAKTEYEPYGYKIPVKVSGKNLFGNLENKWVNVSGTIVTDAKARITQNIPCKEGDIFTISASFSTDISNAILVLNFRDINNNSLIRKVVNAKKNMSLTMTAPTNSAYLVAGHYIAEPDWVQLENGTTSTDYEPYVEPQTVNIYLDEPLRKIGEYADYIDFESGKVVRNIKYMEFTSDDSWTKYVSVGNHFQITVGDNHFSSTENYVLSNYYSEDKNANSYYSSKDYAVISVDGSRIRFKNKDCSTLEEWVSHLSSLENKLYVVYKLATPEDPQTIEIPEVKTYEDYTNIEILTSVAPSKIEATYYGYTME